MTPKNFRHTRERVDVADGHGVAQKQTHRPRQRVRHSQRDAHLGDALLVLQVAQRTSCLARRRGVRREQRVAERSAGDKVGALAVGVFRLQSLGERRRDRRRVRRDVQRDAVRRVGAALLGGHDRPGRAVVQRGGLQSRLHALGRQTRVDLHDDVGLEKRPHLGRTQRQVRGVYQIRAKRFGVADARAQTAGGVCDDRPPQNARELCRRQRGGGAVRRAAGHDEHAAPRRARQSRQRDGSGGVNRGRARLASPVVANTRGVAVRVTRSFIRLERVTTVHSRGKRMRRRSRFPPLQPSQVTLRVPRRAYRSERVAELAVQVHRSRPRAAQDARRGVGRRRPDPRGRAVPGRGQVGVVPRERPEDLTLVDRLVRARASQLGGSVRGEHQQRRITLGGFHRRG